MEWSSVAPSTKPVVMPLAPKASAARLEGMSTRGQLVARSPASDVAANSPPAPITTSSVASSQTSAAANATGLVAQARGEPEITLPSQTAAYLNNPKPAYPPISMRMGEQGRVVVRVLIDDQGVPLQAQLEMSSGHARLDQAAMSAVMSWRFVPGRKGGQPQTMWFSVPITFDLKPAQNG
jgi:protein TonB